MEINSLNSDKLENNTYLINWNIDKWDPFIATYRERNETVIRSPVFTARCLDHTSWFLTILISESKENRFVFCLNRSEEDGGAEIVEIDWKIEVTEKGASVDNNQDKIINLFRKGGSNSWRVLTPVQRKFCPRRFKVTCEMNHRILTKNPALEIAEVYTDASEKYFPLMICPEGSLTGLNNTRLEFSVHETNAVPLSIRIHRTDRNLTFSCYLMCFINVCNGDTRSELIWSGEIDHMHQAIGNGGIINKTVFENEFLNPVSKDVTVYIKYILSEVAVKSSKTIDANATVNTSNVIDENGAVKISNNHNDSTPKINYLAFDLADMYKNEMFSDVTLQIGCEIFKSHKCLLSARSAVFSAMFSQDMREKQTGVVTITDMEVSTLSLLLKFMYTDRIDEVNPENALKLLLAAEKYQVIPLKELCSVYLMNVLSEENVCDILNVADMVQHVVLKASAMEYVKKYAHKVLNSESWKQLVKSNASVVAETLGKISFDLWNTTSKNFEIQS